MFLKKNSPIWANLITGEITPKLKSLPLKLKLNSLKISAKSKKKEVREAAVELCEYCDKNQKMFATDLKLILK